MAVIATRRERVILELEDNFSTGMAKAAASAELLNHELNRLSGQSVQTSRSTQAISRDVDKVGGSAQRADGSINQLTGRLRVLADVAALLGPGLVPIGAVGIPAVAGLANQLGFAAAAGGTLMIAFQGVGNALKAMRKFELEPTAENLADLRRQIEDLSPAAATFVLRSREMADQLKATRDVAAQGVFRGINQSFGEFEQILDRVQPLLATLGDTVGDMIANGADALAGAEWRGFFEFLEREARPTLIEMAATAGDFAHGLAELWMAFEPLNNEFGDWLRGVADGFDSWAAGLAQTQGFEDFIDYVRDNGPQVADTFGALANALLQIVEAAAPLGGPVLAALEAVANAVAVIADSDIGTPLVAGLAAMAALSRATALWAVASKTAVGQFVIGQAKATTGVRTLTRDVAAMRGEYGRMNAAQAVMLSGMSNTTGAAQRVRSSLAAVGKSAGLIGGLAVVTSGLADNLGVANTASLGLMGAMVGGGAGAIAGGLIGATMDFAEAGNQADRALREFDTALDDANGSISGYASQLREAEAAADAFSSSVSSDSFLGHLGKSLTPGGLANNLDVLFGGIDSSKLGQLADESRAAEERLGDLDLAARHLAVGFGIVDDASAATFGDMDQALQQAQPAMQALGISTEDLMNSIRDGSFPLLVGQIQDWIQHADTAAGRSGAVKDAIAALDSEMRSTIDTSKALGDALDALLGPGLSLSAATDAWYAGLQHLDEQLAKTGRSLKGQTDSARTNRDAIRGQVENLVDLMKAQANSGASAGRLTNQMRTGAKAIIEAGAAAGLSKKEVAAYLRELGLTPKLVRTLIDAQTDKALTDIQRIKRELDSIPRSIRTDYFVNQVNAINRPRGPVAQADGGVVPKTGLPYADRHLYLLADGERVTSNRYGQADRYASALDAINRNLSPSAIRGRLADGGRAGGSRRSIEDQLEIAQIMQQIRDLQRSLRKDGKDKLEGLNRRIAELQLRAAEKELRLAEHREEREARQEARDRLQEQRAGIRAAGAGLSFDGLIPEDPQTVAQGVRGEINAFKQEILDAGGTWTKELRAWAKDMMATARQYDAVTAAIEAETEKRDQLVETLNEQQSQLDDLNRTMEAFGAQVASNFLNDPFNQSRTVTVSGDPAAVAALAQAQAQLTAVQAGGGPGAAAQASRLMQQIALLQGPAASSEQTLTGLDALRNVLTTDTANARAFAAALQEAVSRGLDPTGGLYQQLAASGDLTTAQQLAGLSPAEIDQFEAMFKAREDAAAQVAAMTTQAVYGEQQAMLQAQIDHQNQLIAAVDTTLTLLEATQAVLGEQVRVGAEAGAALLQTQLAEINQTLHGLPTATARELKHLIRGGGR